MSGPDPGALVAAGLLLPGLGAAAVALRYVARKRNKYGYEMDDYLCIPALLMTAACGAIVTVAGATNVVNAGDDDHRAQLKIQQMGLAFDILQTFGLASLKISAIFLYRRIFPGRGFNLACSFMAGFVVQWFFTFIISVIVFGIRRLQEPNEQPSQFAVDNAFVDGLLIVLSVENVLVNVALYILPITVTSRLQLSLNQVVKAIAIFIAAGGAIACGILQLALPSAADNDPVASSFDLVAGCAGAVDANSIGIYMLWGVLQLGFLLVAICLPTLGPIGEAIALRWVHRSSKPSQPPLAISVPQQRPDVAPKHVRWPSDLSQQTRWPPGLRASMQKELPPSPPGSRAGETRQSFRQEVGAIPLVSHDSFAKPLASQPRDNGHHVRDDLATNPYTRRPSEINQHIRQASAASQGLNGLAEGSPVVLRPSEPTRGRSSVSNHYHQRSTSNDHFGFPSAGTIPIFHPSGFNDQFQRPSASNREALQPASPHDTRQVPAPSHHVHNSSSTSEHTRRPSAALDSAPQPPFASYSSPRTSTGFDNSRPPSVPLVTAVQSHHYSSENTPAQHVRNVSLTSHPPEIPQHDRTISGNSINPYHAYNTSNSGMINYHPRSHSGNFPNHDRGTSGASHASYHAERPSGSTRRQHRSFSNMGNRFRQHTAYATLAEQKMTAGEMARPTMGPRTQSFAGPWSPDRSRNNSQGYSRNNSQGYIRNYYIFPGSSNGSPGDAAQMNTAANHDLAAGSVQARAFSQRPFEPAEEEHVQGGPRPLSWLRESPESDGEMPEGRIFVANEIRQTVEVV